MASGENAFLDQFGKAAAEQYKNRNDDQFGFQMHLAKTSSNLAYDLEKYHLAWVPDNAERKEYHELHPHLGQAVLGSIAVACAKDEGLDIVAQTDDAPSRELNECLAKGDVSSVYSTFVRNKHPLGDAKISDNAMLEVIVFMTYNVAKLNDDGLCALRDER